MQPEQPDLFTPPPVKREPRLGDCFLCWGEKLCENPDICYPTQSQPSEGAL